MAKPLTRQKSLVWQEHRSGSKPVEKFGFPEAFEQSWEYCNDG